MANERPLVEAVMGMDPRHYLSAAFAALRTDAGGVPFDCSHIYSRGNIAADMYANVTPRPRVAR